MDQSHQITALGDGEASGVQMIAASIREQFGDLAEAVVEQQLDGAEGQARITWQAVARELEALQGRL